MKKEDLKTIYGKSSPGFHSSVLDRSINNVWTFILKYGKIIG